MLTQSTEMDLVLHWKQEPVSPLGYEEVTLIPDETFYQTAFNDDIKLETTQYDEEDDLCESKAEVASQILENLENLMDLDELIKEEPFLLDEKMLPPILDEVEPPRAVPVHNIKYEFKKSDTQSLIQEFENVYDVFELTHGQLTPPQSPPSTSGQSQPMLTTLEPLLTPYEKQTAVTSAFIVPDNKQQQQIMPNGLAYRNIPLEYQQILTPQPDIAHELAVVDELVRTRVEDLQWSGNSNSSSGPSSPSSSSNSSNFGDCSSDDPEWMPETIENCFEFNQNSITSTKQRKRSKPYSRNTEDKKSRKKEQNKNAATRYRMKKKAEVEEILSEEKQLMDHNTTLGTKITDLQREIKYLKGLMRDLFKAKGLIN